MCHIWTKKADLQSFHIISDTMIVRKKQKKKKKKN